MTTSLLIGLNVIAAVIVIVAAIDMYLMKRREWGENE